MPPGLRRRGPPVPSHTVRSWLCGGSRLADVGVTPDLAVDLDDEDFRMLYYDRLAPEDDEQLQAAVAAVRNN